MGMRVRLKASFNISAYPARVQVILRALKKNRMIVADNGSDWYPARKALTGLGPRPFVPLRLTPS